MMGQFADSAVCLGLTVSHLRTGVIFPFSFRCGLTCSHIAATEAKRCLKRQAELLLCAANISPSRRHHSSLTDSLHGRTAESLNVFNSHPSKSLIAVHYFKHIFLVYSVNIMAR